MRVLFDGYWWDQGPISNRMCQRQIVETWRREFPDDELFVAVPRKRKSMGNTEEGIHLIPVAVGRPQVVMNCIRLPQLARKYGVDAVLAHNFAPNLSNAATLVQDVMFMDHPEWFTATENAYFRLMPVSARFSRGRLLASSRVEAERIGRIVKRPALAVGLGASPSLIRATAEKPAAVSSENFLLAVGRLNVRKNLGAAVDGALQSGVLGRSHPLVIVGEESGRVTEWSPSARDALNDGSIVLLGRVTDPELKWLFQNSDAFLMLSLDEGFGLPVAEAIELGTPVIASDIPVFRQEFGDFVEFVDPRDAAAIGAAIRTVMAARRPIPQHVHEWSDVVSRIRAVLAPVEARS